MASVYVVKVASYLPLAVAFHPWFSFVASSNVACSFVVRRVSLPADSERRCFDLANSVLWLICLCVRKKISWVVSGNR